MRDGHLPDKDSVRVEEYVNFFKQDYVPPASDELAFAIHLDGAPAPFGQENYYLMRVGIKGYEVPEEERKEANLIFVIDVSGSMAAENRLELVKLALLELVRELRPSDTVGIVVYGTRAEVVLEPTSASQPERIMTAITQLQTSGSTNLEAGLMLGYRKASQYFKSGGINRVIICSDGVANVGNTSPDEILARVRDYVNQGVYLSTVGFGMGNFNDTLMEQLADDGDGNYAYVDTLDEARRFFVDNLSGTLQVIAKDAKVQVDFNPDVVSRYRLLGYENREVADQDFRDDTVDAGEIGAGHSVTALYEVKFHPEAQGRALSVHVRYEDPDTGEIVEVAREMERTDFRESLAEMSPRFRLSAAVAEYAELLRESYWAREGSMASVLAMADQCARELSNDADVVEFLELVAQAYLLSATQ
jgi:Ca-activated chloride channel family protein